ncbi:HlyD family type I secretion periplasmic adaptor subunit [Azoarcus sp. KH32C]|uniref:HlyD family type I secretion periplasmic adaptor subunit n=1 Tax=Azoarcus sp. KH32C TaxID=748247 RepID=UPI0002386D6F|nr:HlyD family type I secretion periplasmic adaptor subunit [Azoarcus sp. KH32C]BAL23868.1 HlyD-family type I secretion protein [Azoarcus sp. KH32C]
MNHDNTFGEIFSDTGIRDPEAFAAPVVLGNDRDFRRLGLLIVAVVFGVFGLWAGLAPLDSAAVGRGVITVENYRKTVQHLEGGIVRAIQVHDGDKVRRDQVLATLDDTEAKAQLELQRGHWLVALAREARLSAQRDSLERVVYPQALLDATDDPRVQEAMQVQNQTFRVRRMAHEGEIAIYQQQIDQFGARGRGLRAQQQSQQQLASSYKGELVDFEALLNEGFTERQKVRELERNLATSEGRIGELAAQIAETETQIGETRLKIVQLRKDLQREVAQELAEVQADIFALQEKMRALQATMARTVVRAPEPGTVLGLSVHTIGAVIQPGGRMMDIVPEGERLIVDAQMSPLDIDRLRVGQIADLRFTSFKTRETPKIEGRVVNVSADSLSDPEKKESYYLVRVEVSPRGLEDLAHYQLELVPGMPCEVLVNTGSRTFLQYLGDPLFNAVARSFRED